MWPVQDTSTLRMYYKGERINFHVLELLGILKHMHETCMRAHTEYAYWITQRGVTHLCSQRLIVAL